MNGAELLCAHLQAMGIRHFVGIPGTDNLAIYDACEQYDIRPIVVHNEMFAPMFADGYSRISRRTGVVVTIPGPGALATLAGLDEAHASSIPQLMIATDIPRPHLGRRRGHLHEVHNLISAFKPVTDMRVSVDCASAMGYALSVITSGLRDERRTALLHIPTDIYQEEGGSFVPHKTAEAADPLPDLDAAITVLRNAKRPVIFAGGGIWWADAAEPLRELAELLQAPVFTSVKGKGVISDANPLCFGQLAGEPEICERLATCDLALLIGTRWSQHSTDRWSLPLPKTVIEINMKEGDFLMKEPRSMSLIGDAKAILGALIEALDGHIGDREWLEECARAKEQVMRRLRSEAPAAFALLDHLRTAIPDDAIIVNDSTLLTYWARRYLPVFLPATFLWPMGSGTIGWALPAALGAKLAVQESGKDRPVIALVGDGGLQFSLPELGTMVRENLPVVIVLFDNAAYGLIGHFQKKRYGRATAAAALTAIKWKLLASAYGIRYVHARSPERLARAVRASIASGRPTIVRYPIQLEPPERL